MMGMKFYAGPLDGLEGEAEDRDTIIEKYRLQAFTTEDGEQYLMTTWGGRWRDRVIPGDDDNPNPEEPGQTVGLYWFCKKHGYEWRGWMPRSSITLETDDSGGVD